LRARLHLRLGIPVGGMHHTRTYTTSSPAERIATPTHHNGELKQTKGYFNQQQLNRACPDWRQREAMSVARSHCLGRSSSIGNRLGAHAICTSSVFAA